MSSRKKTEAFDIWLDEAAGDSIFTPAAGRSRVRFDFPHFTLVTTVVASYDEAYTRYQEWLAGRKARPQGRLRLVK